MISNAAQYTGIIQHNDYAICNGDMTSITVNDKNS